MNILVNDVTVQFPSNDGGILSALGPVSLYVEAGSFVALLGQSGSGKSTLVRAIAGLQTINSGKILIEDRPVADPHEGVGMMFQDATLMPWRTVHDNIGLPLEMTEMSKLQRDQAVRDILPLLGLEAFGQSYPGELSGGMAQRVALGRALIQQPDILLLDEPFGALDALTRETISFDLLRIWAQYHQTVIMVTHDINEAVLLADRVIVLSRRPGRVVADIEIPLERPRQLDMMYTQPFIETAKSIRQAIDKS
ncbi:MAG: ABC transporter ATP-binding protein [Phototrophicaceae bacterium]